MVGLDPRRHRPASGALRYGSIGGAGRGHHRRGGCPPRPCHLASWRGWHSQPASPQVTWRWRQSQPPTRLHMWALAAVGCGSLALAWRGTWWGGGWQGRLGQRGGRRRDYGMSWRGGKPSGRGGDCSRLWTLMGLPRRAMPPPVARARDVPPHGAGSG